MRDLSRRIEIETKPPHLKVPEYVIRQVGKEHDEDDGWRFQAIVENEGRSAYQDLEVALRYFDSGGRFLGLDEGFVSGSDVLDSGDDRAVSFPIAVPEGSARGVFVVKGRKRRPLEEHSFVIFGIALLVAAILMAIF